MAVWEAEREDGFLRDACEALIQLSLESLEPFRKLLAIFRNLRTMILKNPPKKKMNIKNGKSRVEVKFKDRANKSSTI